MAFTCHKNPSIAASFRLSYRRLPGNPDVNDRVAGDRGVDTHMRQG